MEILTLPVDEWREYRELRLRALREDPEAFSSRYADSLNQPEEYWRTRLAEAAKGERSWLLFARQDGNLLGMVGAFIEDPAADHATVVSVYVPKEARGQGVSTLLIDAMLRLLSCIPTIKQAQLCVNVTQLSAIRLYKRFGFIETGRAPAMTGTGHAVQQLVMQRALPILDARETST